MRIGTFLVIWAIGLFSTIGRGEVVGVGDKDGEIWFREIKALIQNHSIRSVEGLLEKLPPELLSRHILIFESHSRQEASYQFPRVLLVSPRAKFVMTFNGAPHQRGYEGVETMRFTEAFGRAQFLFEEILMEDDRAEREALLSRRFLENELFELREHGTEGKPQLCLACHRLEPRPNWFHYPNWPGVYGQFDDHTLRESVMEITDPTTGMRRTLDNRPAARELPVFVQNAKLNRRYRHLIALEDHLDTGNSFGRTKKEILIRFTQDLAQLNYARIAGLVKQSQFAERDRARLLMGLSYSCDIKKLNLPSPLPTPETYSLQPIRIGYLMQESSLPWRDFYMDTFVGPGNDMITPGFSRYEFNYFLVKGDPELENLFRFEWSEKYGFWAIPKGDLPVCEKLLERAAPH